MFPGNISSMQLSVALVVQFLLLWMSLRPSLSSSDVALLAGASAVVELLLWLGLGAYLAGSVVTALH